MGKIIKFGQVVQGQYGQQDVIPLTLARNEDDEIEFLTYEEKNNYEGGDSSRYAFSSNCYYFSIQLKDNQKNEHRDNHTISIYLQGQYGNLINRQCLIFGKQIKGRKECTVQCCFYPITTVSSKLNRIIVKKNSDIDFIQGSAKVIKLFNLKQIIDRNEDTETNITKIGIMANPGTKMCIDGQLIIMNHRGVYEVFNEAVEFKYICIVQNAKDFLDRQTMTQNWLIDYQYQVDS